jgi:hypothetical protein
VRTVAAALLGATTVLACVSIERQPGVLIASDPPGARLLVDGRDSGFVTPCNVALARERQRVDLELEGFEPVSLVVDERGGYYLIHWREALVSNQTWRFPLWLNYRDGFFPVKLVRGYAPARIFVPLDLAREPVEEGSRAGAPLPQDSPATRP